jgi:hypothetical protein
MKRFIFDVVAPTALGAGLVLCAFLLVFGAASAACGK